MKNLLIVGLFVLSIITLAQEKGSPAFKPKFVGSGNLTFLSEPDKGETQGSMYIVEKFSPVKLGGVQQEFTARYNAFNDRLEFKDGDNVYEYYPNLNDQMFWLTGINKKYQYLTYKDKTGNLVNGYLVEKYSVKGNKLYLKEKIKFIPGQASKTGIDRTYPDRYVKEDNVLYLQLAGGEIKEVPTNKKDFIKLFGENESKVNQIMKSEGYSFKEESDIIKILNSL